MLPSPFSIDCPTDILVECFLWCTTPNSPSVHPNDAPILLTRICRLWRNVALSTPLLWSRLLMRVPSHDEEPLHYKSLACFESCLDRSTEVPLTCTLLDQTKSGSSYFDRYLEVLLRHSLRWKSITLVSSSRRPALDIDAVVFPVLTCLKVDWINDADCSLMSMYENAPNLRFLSIRSSHAYDCFAIASQLTSLSLSHFSRTERFAVLLPLRPTLSMEPLPEFDSSLLNSLSSFSSLTSLHIGTFAYFQRDFGDEDHPTEKVELPNIRTFSFPISDAAFPTIWLSAITFPSLVHLSISPQDTFDIRSNDHLNDILEFVRRHADSVRELTLGSPSTSMNDHRLEVIRLLPQLETLQLASIRSLMSNAERLGDAARELIGFVESRCVRGRVKGVMDGKMGNGALRHLHVPQGTMASLRAPENVQAYKRLQRCIREGLLVEEGGSGDPTERFFV